MTLRNQQSRSQCTLADVGFYFSITLTTKVKYKDFFPKRNCQYFCIYHHRFGLSTVFYICRYTYSVCCGVIDLQRKYMCLCFWIYWFTPTNKGLTLNSSLFSLCVTIVCCELSLFLNHNNITLRYCVRHIWWCPNLLKITFECLPSYLD